MPTVTSTFPKPATGSDQKPRPYLAYLWLSYCGFIFIEPVFNPSWGLWLATLASLAIFIAIFTTYVRLTDNCSSKARWMILATVVLGLLCLPWNGGTSTYLIYAAGFLPFAFASIRRVLLLLAGEILCIVGEHYVFSQPHHLFYLNWGNAIMAIFLSLIIGGSNIFFAEQKRSNTRLQMAQDEIEAIAAVAERERIARDLHDVLGHTLSVITLKAELAGRLLISDSERAGAEINEVERMARTALAEVREAIGGYRAKGLAAEIELARRTLDAANVTLTAELPEKTHSGLSATEETVLALAVREAVTNIVRHAKATRCTLRFVSNGERHELVVEDNGENTTDREGNGLRGMRERVEAIGGRLSLQRGRGTTLMIELPRTVEASA